MARLPQGILGGVVGSVGTLVGTSWKGIPIIKTKPLSVSNPKTTKQLAQRGKMKNIVAFTQPILSTIVKPLNDRFAQRQSGYNLFVSRNIKLFESEFPSPAGDLVVSRGKLGDTAITGVTAGNDDTELGIAINPALDNAFKQDTDLVYVLVVNETSGAIVGGVSQEVRGDAVIGFHTIEEFYTGDVLQIYLSFLRADGTMVSNTSHSTKIV